MRLSLIEFRCVAAAAAVAAVVAGLPLPKRRGRVAGWLGIGAWKAINLQVETRRPVLRIVVKEKEEEEEEEEEEKRKRRRIGLTESLAASEANRNVPDSK